MEPANLKPAGTESQCKVTIVASPVPYASPYPVPSPYIIYQPYPSPSPYVVYSPYPVPSPYVVYSPYPVASPYPVLVPYPSPVPAHESSLGLSMPAVMEFNEGTKSEYLITAWAPSPGTPVVQVNNLPSGAIFDATTGKISWTPGFGAAIDHNDPLVGLGIYRGTVELHSTTSASVFIRRDYVMLVKRAGSHFSVHHHPKIVPEPER